MLRSATDRIFALVAPVHSTQYLFAYSRTLWGAAEIITPDKGSKKEVMSLLTLEEGLNSWYAPVHIRGHSRYDFLIGTGASRSVVSYKMY